MSKVVLDPELRDKLGGAVGHIELQDEGGQTVAHVLPDDTYRQLVHAWLKTQATDAELDRDRNEPGGSSLADIWQRLGRAS